MKRFLLLFSLLGAPVVFGQDAQRVVVDMSAPTPTPRPHESVSPKPKSRPTSSPKSVAGRLAQNTVDSASADQVTREATPAPSPVRELVAPSPSSTPPQAARLDPEGTSSNVFTQKPANEIFAFLARKAGLSFFFNTQLDNVLVTGELAADKSPLESAQNVAFNFGLTLYTKDNTLYVLTQDQVNALPAQTYTYQLKYLRPKDDNDIQRMIGHMLTPNTGYATLEKKEMAIVVVDNEPAIRRISAHLQRIDQARRQIAIQVRVLSIAAQYGKHTGVDWSQSLGSTGTNISASLQYNLNEVFGMAQQAISSAANSASSVTNPSSSSTGSSGTSNLNSLTPQNTIGVVVGPVTVSAILHALYDKNRVSSEQSPLLVTEENEQATTRVVQRIPIVVSTVTQSTTGNTINNDVRYKIDPSDPTMPVDQRREVGTSVTITPQVFYDPSTKEPVVYLDINGTVATISAEVPVVSGVQGALTTNNYPQITEALFQNKARVPSGATLLVGGLQTTTSTEQESKIPVIGDLPIIGTLGKHKEMVKQTNNIVLMITPQVYNPSSPTQTEIVTENQKRAATLRTTDTYPDPEHLGENVDNSSFRDLGKSHDVIVPDTNPLSERYNGNDPAPTSSPTPNKRSRNKNVKPASTPAD